MKKSFLREVLPPISVLILLLLMLALSSLQSCNDTAEDEVSSVDKSGSVEVEFSTKHIDDKTDVLTCKRTIWKGGQIVRVLTVNDTVPSLGVTKEVGENEEGEEKEISVARDYEFFVTIK